MKFSKFNIFVKKRNDQYYYLFNTLTGSTFIVDENVKREVEKDNVKYFNEKLRKNIWRKVY